MSDAEKVASEYESSLEDLRVNSKPHINMLTMVAEENLPYAQEIVKVIERRIHTVEVDGLLPALYLIDSIVKNIGGEYKALFAKNIVKIFCFIFSKVDEARRTQLYKLRQTWTGIFSNSILYSLDVEVKKIDPAWPILALPPQPSIHINPKFLEQKLTSENIQPSLANDTALQSETLEAKTKDINLKNQSSFPQQNIVPRPSPIDPRLAKREKQLVSNIDPQAPLDQAKATRRNVNKEIQEKIKSLKEKASHKVPELTSKQEISKDKPDSHSSKMSKSEQVPSKGSKIPSKSPPLKHSSHHSKSKITQKTQPEQSSGKGDLKRYRIPKKDKENINKNEENVNEVTNTKIETSIIKNSEETLNNDVDLRLPSHSQSELKEKPSSPPSKRTKPPSDELFGDQDQDYRQSSSSWAQYKADHPESSPELEDGNFQGQKQPSPTHEEDSRDSPVNTPQHKVEFMMTKQEEILRDIDEKFKKGHISQKQYDELKGQLSRLNSNEEITDDIEIIEPKPDNKDSHVKLFDQWYLLHIKGDKAFIYKDGGFREIYFKGDAKYIYVNEKEFMLNFGGELKYFTIDGINYSFKFGIPSREIFIDGKPYEIQFDNVPKKIWLGNKLYTIRLSDPPPLVEISNQLTDFPKDPPFSKQGSSTLPPQDIDMRNLRINGPDQGQSFRPKFQHDLPVSEANNSRHIETYPHEPINFRGPHNENGFKQFDSSSRYWDPSQQQRDFPSYNNRWLEEAKNWNQQRQFQDSQISSGPLQPPVLPAGPRSHPMHQSGSRPPLGSKPPPIPLPSTGPLPPPHPPSSLPPQPNTLPPGPLPPSSQHMSYPDQPRHAVPPHASLHPHNVPSLRHHGQRPPFQDIQRFRPWNREPSYSSRPHFRPPPIRNQAPDQPPNFNAYNQKVLVAPSQNLVPHQQPPINQPSPHMPLERHPLPPNQKTSFTPSISTNFPANIPQQQQPPLPHFNPLPPNTSLQPNAPIAPPLCPSVPQQQLIRPDSSYPVQSLKQEQVCQAPFNQEQPIISTSDSSFLENNQSISQVKPLLNPPVSLPLPENKDLQKPLLSTLPVDINTLFDKLVKTGIISKSAPPPNDKKEPTENKTEEKPLPLALVSNTLRIKRPEIIESLYFGNQCSSCGQRFSSKQMSRYGDHLDWHFRSNRREKNSLKKAFSRKWYYDKEEWCKFTEYEDPEERQPSFFEEQQEADKSPEPIQLPTVLAPTEESENKCSTCGERFDIIWQEELEEWHLSNAVKEDDLYFHPFCLDDYKKFLASEAEVSMKDADSNKNEDSNNNSKPNEAMDSSSKPEEDDDEVIIMEVKNKNDPANVPIMEIEEDSNDDEKNDPIDDLIKNYGESSDDIKTMGIENTDDPILDPSQVTIKSEPIDEEAGNTGEVIGEFVIDTSMDVIEEPVPDSSKDIVVMESGNFVLKVKAQSIIKPTENNVSKEQETVFEEEGEIFVPPPPDPRFTVVSPVKRGTEHSGLCLIM